MKSTPSSSAREFRIGDIQRGCIGARLSQLASFNVCTRSPAPCDPQTVVFLRSDSLPPEEELIATDLMGVA